MPGADKKKIILSVLPNHVSAVASVGGSLIKAFSPVVELTETEDGVVISITDAEGIHTATVYNGETGPEGPEGPEGKPGVSPAVSMSEIDGGVLLTITDAEGEHSAVIWDGTDGTDGVSPTVSVTEITGGHRVEITDAEGTATLDVMDGVNGTNGTNGTDGRDGFSPEISVTEIDNGHRVSITDADGTETFDVTNGVDGTNGTNGTDGVSPSVTVTAITGGHRVTVTDAQGDETFDVMDGTNGTNGKNGKDGKDGTNGVTFTPAVSNAGVISWTNDGGLPNPESVNIKGPQGDPGNDYVLTAQDKSDIAALAAAEIDISGKADKVANAVSGNFAGLDANGNLTDSGSKASDFLTQHQTIPVTDVRVNGTSVLSSGVANVPVAGENVYGVIKSNGEYGVYVNTSGFLQTSSASSSVVKAGTNTYRTIKPSNQHEAAFYGLAKAAGDTTQSSSSNAVGTYTSAAKTAIQTMLGVETGVTYVENVTGSTPTITANANTRYICGEVTSLSFTPFGTGICDVRFTSGSTVAVLTVPNTVKWPGWFDPSSLDTNTTYEINVLDGVYGVVAVWAS